MRFEMFANSKCMVSVFLQCPFNSLSFRSIRYRSCGLRKWARAAAAQGKAAARSGSGSEFWILLKGARCPNTQPSYIKLKIEQIKKNV